MIAGVQDAAIQPHGFLLILSPDWIVEHASINADEFLGESHVTLIGEPLSRFVMSEPLHDLRNRLAGVQRLFGVKLLDEPRRFDLSVQVQDGQILFEGTLGRDSYGESFGAVAALSKALHRERLIEDGARRMRALTGYDRVLLCLGDEHADSRRAGIELPACIPVQCDRTTVVADVDAQRVAMFPTSEPFLASALAAPSQDDIAQIRGVGARSAMHIPINLGGECVGSFQCYHRTPRAPSLELQAAAELFAQIFAMQVEISDLEER